MTRRYHTEAGDEGTYDDLVGLIVSGSVIAADEPNDGSIFSYYDHLGRYNDIERQRLKKTVEEYGYQMSQQLALAEE